MGYIRTDLSYSYTQMMDDIEFLTRKFPFLRCEVLGASVMGRDIPALRLGMGCFHVHVNGSFHANEWITTLLLMKFTEDCAESYANGLSLEGVSVTSLLDTCSLWIVPMVNPDGVELVLRGLPDDHRYFHELLAWNNGSSDFSGWKANIRGIDLNDQFPAFWEAERTRRLVNRPGPRDYGGTAPLTEPEAIIMANWTDVRQFDRVFALHTQGREIYWNYRDLEPAESEPLALELAGVSGYKPLKLRDSDAGYKDWFIQRYRRPGYTLESGWGCNPLPITQFDQMYDELVPMLLRGMKL
ncbi:M14 family metallopeptidase [Paenibacillus swuensis]|uniref:M14 family metallopeptidase n=1 Tax=Paenibacillus swuensis TaxID=1178515 RepID=UPI000838F48D|nr:M14 family metallocarboxypeptidase [Paenibacillus swuensis]